MAAELFEEFWSVFLKNSDKNSGQKSRRRGFAIFHTVNDESLTRRVPRFFINTLLSFEKMKIFDLSFASTETKYIKLKTKTQNNIVIFGFFS